MFRHAAPFPLLALLASPAIALAQANNPSFNLINKTDVAIREFYATPAGMENWGQSRLEGKPLSPGGTFAVRLRADGNCIYDLRVVFANGKTEDRRRVDTCKTDDFIVSAAAGTTASTPASAAHDPSFRLVNRGKSAITEVYANPVKAGAHGDNLLTEGMTLAPQDAHLFTLPPGEGCVFDLRVVFADKQSRARKGADLCKTGDLPVQ